MIIPIRCFTCGKLLGNKWGRYTSLLNEGKSPKEIFIILGIIRYCCKTMLLTHVEVIDTLVKYKDNTGNDKSLDSSDIKR